MKDKLATVLENSKRYSLQVAAQMPESMYLFRPTAEVWNFTELISHMAYGISWWENNYIKNTETPWNPPPVTEKKEAVLAGLTQAYDSLIATVKQADMNEDRLNGIYATLDHITHHRGQAVLFLRMKGITPPEYSY